MFSYIGGFFSTVWHYNMRLHDMVFSHSNPAVRVVKAVDWSILVSTIARTNMLAALVMVGWNFFTVITSTIIDLA